MLWDIGSLTSPNRVVPMEADPCTTTMASEQTAVNSGVFLERPASNRAKQEVRDYAQATQAS